MSNNKIDNSGTPLAVDDQTVEGDTTAVSGVVSSDVKQKDNVETLEVNTLVNDPSLKPASFAEIPS